MISLIVCSVNPEYLEKLKENVSSTIGVSHQWLVWDNRNTNTGLCEVYNVLAAKAEFPYLCFLHEDLLFQSQNWGAFLIQFMENDPSLALIGIAGGKYKSRLYSGWYSGGSHMDYYNVIHRSEGQDIKLLYPSYWRNTVEPVACIDGIFMFCPKEIWQQHFFNEGLLKGFHFYDIDFSLRVAKERKVVVTNKIEIVHLTKGGDYGDKWVNEAFLFHDSMTDALPFSVEKMNAQTIELSVAKYWLDWLKSQPISFTNRLKWIRKQKVLWNLRLLYGVTKFLLYQPLGLKGIHHFFKKKR